MTIDRKPVHPVVLTFLAPADQCNQYCPKCFIKIIRLKNVQDAKLNAPDYALFLHQFIEAKIPIISVAFQGYEVTLPRSWSYLENVFFLAKKYDIRRSFITNGMLLHKYTDRIKKIDPQRISVSIDGADPETNDKIRGLKGAFETTSKSVRKFLDEAPEFKDRVAIASTLYDGQNFDSLINMPRLLKDWGVFRWTLSIESIQEPDGKNGPALDKHTALSLFRELNKASAAEGINCFVIDEFGYLDAFETKSDELKVVQLPDATRLYRLDPLGHVYSGADLSRIASNDDPTWNPNSDYAPDFVKYF